MSVQSVNNSTAALTSQWLQSQSSSLFGSSDVQSLPQLSGDQLQQLRQALQQDVQQAFAGQTSGGGANGSSSSGSNPNGSTSSLQTQLDQSISNTLSQFGFSDSQTQSVLDKLNQALSGAQGASGHAHRGHGHARHHVQQALNGIFQALQNNSSGQTSNTDSSAGSSNSSTTSLNGITAIPLSSSGQSIDLTA
jgi:hypothetical protein